MGSGMEWGRQRRGLGDDDGVVGSRMVQGRWRCGLGDGACRGFD
jgi:hypothetical protein